MSETIFNYTIGITTFDLRFNQLKVLIDSIRQYSNSPIIVTINGNINGPCNEEYREQSLAYFSKIKNIYPIYFTELRGLAKMINTIFIHSNTENVLILNDDIIIKDAAFFEDLNESFKCLEDLCLLQNTWYGSFSHFIAKKSCIRELGYYDERFLGFGEEDGDITYRYIKKYNKSVPLRGARGLEHTQSEVRQNVKAGVGKYSWFNRNFAFSEKYKLGEGHISGMFGQPAIELIENIPQYPYEQFFEENKSKLV